VGIHDSGLKTVHTFLDFEDINHSKIVNELAICLVSSSCKYHHRPVFFGDKFC
jgi:Ser/Thr protein kinase RdoA (MazF antagonist)